MPSVSKLINFGVPSKKPIAICTRDSHTRIHQCSETHIDLPLGRHLHLLSSALSGRWHQHVILYFLGPLVIADWCQLFRFFFFSTECCINRVNLSLLPVACGLLM
jgi:hypothetical protein